MKTLTKFTNDCKGNSAVYKGEVYKILQVNEDEQLFLIQESHTTKESLWVRTDNVDYIPF